ncbi:hypothetical protein QPM17_16095 [Marinobacter sp. TBZ242]|uniref:Translational machinery protein n=1 Tax=Marinobacter azerbaijanicus TaxID=3050455 RepID=A0ABT7IHN3_9GAMM|nr:hypothetical protein [Marinobacter sp. TBZ242]MDL0432663.1 hypothetical protein [Marinobacter sp. TBZ242]
MSILAGIWMDHRKAVTVILGSENLDMSIIESNEESVSETLERPRRMAPHARHDVEINRYFDKILRRIKAADELVLIGPGEAKRQFISFLMLQRSAIKLRECMPVGCMTNSEVAQHVCRVFNRSYY